MKRLVLIAIFALLLWSVVPLQAQEEFFEDCPLFFSLNDDWQVKKGAPEGVLSNFMLSGCQLEQVIQSANRGEATAQDVLEHQRPYVLAYKTLLPHIEFHSYYPQDMTDIEGIERWLEIVALASVIPSAQEVEVVLGEAVCYEGTTTCETPLVAQTASLVGVLTYGGHDFTVFYEEFAVYRSCTQVITEETIMQAFECPLIAVMIIDGNNYRIWNSLALAITPWQALEE